MPSIHCQTLREIHFKAIAMLTSAWVILLNTGEGKEDIEKRSQNIKYFSALGLDDRSGLHFIHDITSSEFKNNIQRWEKGKSTQLWVSVD